MPTDVKPLSRLEPVELRTIWESESGDFTPWLAQEENLALLGDAIGLELELEAQEKWVGAFRADLLCRNTATNDWVLIENQLDRTDHGHLGQLLTYAAGLEAATIVWIAQQFTDEHRAALDWLNEITGDRFAFFGVEIELWRIADSPIAPKFNVLCRPNDWSERVREGAGDEITETRLWQQEYWATLRDQFLKHQKAVKPTKPLPQSWCSFAIGRSWFGIHASVNTPKKWIRVAVSCYGPNALGYFRLLEAQKTDIEREVGCALEWEELPGKKEKRIGIRKNDVDPTDREDWPVQHAWLAEKLEVLHRAFAPRIKELEVGEREPAGE